MRNQERQNNQYTKVLNIKKKPSARQNMQTKGKESLVVTATVLFVLTEQKIFFSVRQF